MIVNIIGGVSLTFYILSFIGSCVKHSKSLRQDGYTCEAIGIGYLICAAICFK